MSDNVNLSVERHEWAGHNRKTKYNVEYKAYVNGSPVVVQEYNALIGLFEAWRNAYFGDAAGGDTAIVGRPQSIFPCTYQEWSGDIPFDLYTEPGEGGAPAAKPVWGPQLAKQATKFRQAVGLVRRMFKVAANINREDNNRPGEGENAPGGLPPVEQ